MTSKTITGIVTWLKGWFYTKDEITTKENALQTQINNKASQSDFNTLSSNVANKLDAGDYVVDSALSDGSTNPVQNKVITGAVVALNNSLTGKAPNNHSHTSAKVIEYTALSNIGTSANATQHDINSAIDTAISNLTGAEIIKAVTTLPTASTSTMNALYLLSSNGQYDIYITVQNGSSYAWEKLDDDVLSDLSIDWSDIENKPSTFTPSSHTHGNINANGTISTTIATSSIAGFSTLNFPLVRDSTDSAKIKIGLVPTEMVRSSTAYSNIGSSANATQNTINGLIDTAIGGLWDGVEGKRNVQRAHCEVPDEAVEEGHYYKLGGIVYNTQNQGMSFLDVMVDDYDRIVQVCYEYDNGEAPDNDVHQYIRYSTNNGSTWSAWKRFVEEDEVTNKADKSSVIDWDTLTFVAKADDESGAITFDYLE